MKRGASSSTKRGGRPRSVPTQQAILSAASVLLAERGPAEISIEAIAARAGASKATIYRWWPSKEALLLDAFQATLEAATTEVESADSFTDALLAAVQVRLAFFAAHPEAARTMAALLAASHEDPGFAAAYAGSIVEPLRTAAQEIAQSAMARGELAPDADVELVVDVVLGSINQRILHRHAQADEPFARALVALVGRAVGAGSSPADVPAHAGEALPAHHRHVLVVYEDEARALRSLGPVIEEGLARGEKAIHLVNPATRASYVRELEAAGVPVTDAERRGQFEMCGWDETYLRTGSFDQEAMLALIEELLTAPGAQGYPGTRLVAHMEWALEGRPGSEHLMTYESRLNDVLPGHHDAIICLYDAAKFGGDLLLDALRTHPLLLKDGHLHTNPVYVPPDQFIPRSAAAPRPTADA